MSHTSQILSAYGEQVHAAEVHSQRHHVSSATADSSAAANALIDEFLRYLSTYRRASPLTVDAYGRDLTRLEAFLQARGVALSPSALEPPVLEAFAISLSGYAPATINRALNASSSFCSFLVRTGRLDRNPVDSVLKPRKQRRLPDIPELDDCRALIAAAADVREQTMLLMLAGAGLRRAELLDLRLSDLSAD
jgi:site-specific recombinase XerC